MASVPAPARSPARARLAALVQGQGALIALVLLVVFGALRYDNFLSSYNVTSFLANNAKFGLIALGMTFVIMTGGIDLSVGAVAALASVVAAMVSDRGLVAGIAVPVAVGVVIGLVNGSLVAWGRLQPFIVTLAMLLAARGLALTVAGNQSVSVDFESGFTALGTTTLLTLAAPIWIFAVAYLLARGRTEKARAVVATSARAPQAVRVTAARLLAPLVPSSPPVGPSGMIRSIGPCRRRLDPGPMLPDSTPDLIVSLYSWPGSRKWT